MSIKTLSPYYVTVPLINPLTETVCESYTLKIYIWNGSKTAVPLTSNYDITKINASMSNGNDKIDIARIVNDYIEFKCIQLLTTGLQSADNQVWVKYEIYYNDLADVPSIQQVTLATKGYGFFLEGENPQLPSNKVLLSGDEFKVNRNGFFVMPLLSNEPAIASRILGLISVTNISDDLYSYSVTSTFAYSNLYMFLRNVGDTEYKPVPAISGEFILPSGIVAPFEARATAFDSVTSQNINSNILTVS
jgi:hypothetical protein